MREQDRKRAEAMRWAGRQLAWEGCLQGIRKGALPPSERGTAI